MTRLILIALPAILAVILADAALAYLTTGV